MASFRSKSVKLLFAGIAVVVLGGLFSYLLQNKDALKDSSEEISTLQTLRTPEEPKLVTRTVAEGLSNVWDIVQAPTPDETIFYTERNAVVGAIIDDQPTVIHKPEDVVVGGEGGMLGMTLDPQFTANRFMYVCFNTISDVRIVRFTVAQDNLSLGSRTDIVTGLPVNPSGRHSGCRPKFAPDGYLWIGTGDAAQNTNPQNPNSLGGKVLRVDRDGKAAPGNMAAPFDQRIYSFGHRNVQGLAFYRQPRDGVIGYSVEHGPDKDDEINVLEKGNFGWDPGPGYDESVAMTDLKKFPDAISATWSSGRSTIAPSGAAILEGKQWKSWEGRLMMAVQKDKHVRLMNFDATGKTLDGEEEILNQFGRVRTVTLGTDGNIYLATDNGKSQDKIIRVIPQ